MPRLIRHVAAVLVDQYVACNATSHAISFEPAVAREDVNQIEGANAGTAAGGTRLIYCSGPGWMIRVAIPVALLLVTFALLALLWIDAVTGRTPWPDLVITLLWISFAYLAFWRVAFDLEYAEGTLRCRGLIRTWRFPLSAVQRIRPALIDIGFQVIETQTQPATVLVCVSRRFGAFATALRRRDPSIDVRMGWVSRLWERIPWPSSFEEV